MRPLSDYNPSGFSWSIAFSKRTTLIDPGIRKSAWVFSCAVGKAGAGQAKEIRLGRAEAA
jgi:hypothetical protein